MSEQPLGGNHVLYAPPKYLGKALYRGVAATDRPDELLAQIDRSRWVLLYLAHGAETPPYHAEIDLYQIDPFFESESPQPTVHAIVRDFTCSDTYRPLGLPKQYDVVFNAAWYELKRPDLLLNAVKYAAGAGRPISCLWFGHHWRQNGPELEAAAVTDARAHRLPISFLPTKWDPEEVNRRHNLCRMAVGCSASEAGPRVMAEAMLADLPYIATEDTYGGSPQYFRPENANGRVCAATPRGIAEAVWRVLDDLSIYRPREWALSHMCRTVGLARLRDALVAIGQTKEWLINLDAVTFGDVDWHGRSQEVQRANRL